MSAPAGERLRAPEASEPSVAPHGLEAPGEAPRELTVRAVGAGLLIGALLALINVYMGLKTGMWESGSLLAAVLGFSGLASLARRRGSPYTPLENNITQTAAAAVGAMPAAVGLLGAVPAMMMVGVSVSGWGVAAWGVALGALGVLAAALLRRRLVVEEALPFPTGTATAELISTLHATRPPGATQRSGRGRTLAGAGAVAMAITWLRDARGLLPSQWVPPGSLGGVPLSTLGWGVGISPMLLAVGMLTGLHLGLSMLAGAGVAWGVLAPWLVSSGRVSTVGFEALAAWLVWPGVGLLVGAAVASLVAQARDFLGVVKDLRALGGAEAGALPRWAGGVAVGAVLLTLGLGAGLFGLGARHLLLALVLLLPLCAVCARGAGQTDVSPVGQMGQLSQALAGALVPSAVGSGGLGAAGALSVTSGVQSAMGPNVAVGSVVAGAAAQTGVSMWSLKAGHVLGASPRRQLIAQLLGVLAGAAVGVPAWLLLVGAYGLGSAALPAPSAQQFRAVAEVAVQGLAGLPPQAGLAAGVGFAVGVALSLAARGRAARWLPSPVAMGIGFITPASFAVTLCLGAGLVVAARRRWPEATVHHVPAVGAGAIAGESLMGLLIAALLALGVMRPG
ncbi:OPT/YSL family transporter [Myxococcaceae bacterium JPH2]|nr:OPT/YSL family transporter [Myxococcaceae bacterium JPH2]